MEINSNEIVVTGASGNLIKLDLVKLAKIEARITEIQFVNFQTAPELLSVFISAMAAMQEKYAILAKELSTAERKVDQIKACIYLDKAEGEFQKRGLKATDKLREMLLYEDEKYNAACEYVDEIKAVMELVKGKGTAFELAHSAVKKIIQVQDSNNGAFSNMKSGRI